jgi:hypothetical protein
MEEILETKQNPVVELSGFCYTSCIKRFVLADLPLESFLTRNTNNKVLEKFESRKNNFHHLLSHLPFRLSAEKSRLVLTYLYKHELLKVFFCLLFPFVFKERSTRSESIITNLTSEVKSVVLKLRKIWLQIKVVLERMGENLSKNGLTVSQVLTGCGAILSERLRNFMKYQLSTSSQCGVI